VHTPLSDVTPQTDIAKEGAPLKTFRIPKRLYTEIQAQAKTRGLSPNAAYTDHDNPIDFVLTDESAGFAIGGVTI
jgi:hypothetical protein